MITALTSLAALVFTGQSLSATRDQITQSEQAQITDRYTKAIEQIDVRGDDHLEIRLGGIYALERISRDSPRDQPTIVEVLSAFVRSSVPQSGFQRLSEPCPSVNVPFRPLSLDIIAALTVLGRRDVNHDNGAAIDLRSTCFVHADLSDLNLANANLSGADLAGSSLDRANLAGANLNDADLTAADLAEADLTGTDLSGSDLTNAVLSGAKHDENTILDSVDSTGAMGLPW